MSDVESTFTKIGDRAWKLTDHSGAGYPRKFREPIQELIKKFVGDIPHKFSLENKRYNYGERELFYDLVIRFECVEDEMQFIMKVI
jgi:hypothetical protein